MQESRRKMKFLEYSGTTFCDIEFSIGISRDSTEIWRANLVIASLLPKVLVLGESKYFGLFCSEFKAKRICFWGNHTTICASEFGIKICMDLAGSFGLDLLSASLLPKVLVWTQNEFWSFKSR